MEKGRRVFLDYASGFPLCEAAAQAMNEAALLYPANPNSLHTAGREAYGALEGVRERIAELLGASRPSEIIFTSGGTESDCLALLGLSDNMAKSRRVVAVSAFEHHAILNTEGELSRRGKKMARLAPSRSGFVDPDIIEKLGPEGLGLVSVMAANNEIGTVQPIEALAQAAHEAGALFHTDAIQAVGKVGLRLDASGVDAASFSAHKFAGPRGFGFLYLRSGTLMRPQIAGGGQERGWRGGTQNLAGAFGALAALEQALSFSDEECRRESKLQDLLLSKLDLISGVHIVCDPRRSDGPHLPNIVAFCLESYESELAVLKLDEAGFEVSGGAACSSGNSKPSHVLESIGIDEELSQGQVRVSFGPSTIAEEVEGFAQALKDVILSV